MRRALFCTLFAAVLFIGEAEARTFKVVTGVNADVSARAAFDQAQAGDSIRFDEGQYDLTVPLILNASGIDIRGQGADKTILSFAGMRGEGDAITVRGDHNQIRDLTVAGAKGAGIVIAGTNALMEKVSVRGALGPGVMTRGANNVIIRETFASGALAGFSIENSLRVDLIQNNASRNGTGIVVIDRPDRAGGGGVRLVGNIISGNSTQGIGVDIVAARDVALFENQISEHGTANVFIRAYDGDTNNINFVALPRNVTIWKNGFGRAGFAPSPDWAPAMANGAKFADIVWDGARSYVAGGRPKSEPVLISIKGNKSTIGVLRFLSLGLEVAGSPASESSPSAQWPLVANFVAPGEVKIK